MAPCCLLDTPATLFFFFSARKKVSIYEGGEWLNMAEKTPLIYRQHPNMESRLSTIILVFLSHFLSPFISNSREYKNIKGDGNSNEKYPLDAWNWRKIDRNQSAWTFLEDTTRDLKVKCCFPWDERQALYETIVADRSRLESWRKCSKPSEQDN